jgi:predicted DNA-binding protein (UPF0251 family)
MSNITIDKAIEIGVQAGVKEALDRIQSSKEQKMKYRHDRRLRNTKLLLRNYNNFTKHCEKAVFTSTQLDNLNPVDILDECEDIEDNELYVNSIKRTHDRTYIIIQHINTIMEFFKYRAEKENNDNALRRFNAIELVFVEKISYEKVAEQLGISEKTVSRDVKQAVEELSSLIFGIDGVRLEV